MHRDIKACQHHVRAGVDTVKVTDFGIARITDSSKTKTGLVLGTPSFMSPEQIAGKKVDGRSDLYSLGVMLFQMLTGVLPFRGDSMAELMYKIANEEAPTSGLSDPKSIRPRLALQWSHFQDGTSFAGVALEETGDCSSRCRTCGRPRPSARVHGFPLNSSAVPSVAGGRLA